MLNPVPVLVRTVSAMVGAGLGASIALLPNTVFLGKLKDATQSYKSGWSVPVPEHIQELFAQVKADIAQARASTTKADLPTDKELDRVSLYTVFGFDMYRAGMLEGSCGALVGIPQHLDDRDRTRTLGIRLSNEPVDWSSEAGQQLQGALLLSDDAKKFAIATQVLCLKQSEVILHASNNSMFVLMTMVMSSGLDKRFNMSSKPRAIRYILYAMVSAIAASFWMLFQDAPMVYLEKEADRVVAGLSDDYQRGGLEYCSQMLLRNTALRKLMGDAGQRKYTARGNEESWFRTRHQPMVERAEFFKTLIENRMKQEEVLLQT